jgi:hypothetical protein
MKSKSLKVIPGTKKRFHLNVVEDVCKNLLLCNSEVRIVIVGMRAVVNDT